MKFFLGLMFGTAVAGSLLGAGTVGTVNATRVNARIRAELKSPVAFVLKQGEKVNIVRQTGNWVEFEAPENTPVFISAVHIRDGKTTSELNMRSAGAAGAPLLGTLPAGSAVKVLAETKYGWVKIAPPPGIVLFAAKFYFNYDNSVLPAGENKTESDSKTKPTVGIVKPIDKVAAKPIDKVAAKPIDKVAAKPIDKAAAKPVDKAAAKPVEIVKPIDKVAAKPGESVKPAEEKMPAVDLERELENLFAQMESKRSVTLTGKVVKVPNSKSVCTNFALLEKEKNLAFLCAADSAQLASAVDKDVKISGFAYTVVNWKAPIVKVETISPAK